MNYIYIREHDTLILTYNTHRQMSSSKHHHERSRICLPIRVAYTVMLGDPMIRTARSACLQVLWSLTSHMASGCAATVSTLVTSVLVTADTGQLGAWHTWSVLFLVLLIV